MGEVFIKVTTQGSNIENNNVLYNTKRSYENSIANCWSSDTMVYANTIRIDEHSN